MDGWNEGRRRRGKWEAFDEGKINVSSVALEKQQQIMVIIIIPLLLMIATMVVMVIIVIVTLVMLNQLDD